MARKRKTEKYLKSRLSRYNKLYYQKHKKELNERAKQRYIDKNTRALFGDHYENLMSFGLGAAVAT